MHTPPEIEVFVDSPRSRRRRRVIENLERPGECERVEMCSKRTLSWASVLGISFGLLSAVFLGVSLSSDYWLYCSENVYDSSSGRKSNISFRIGLWTVCPVFSEGIDYIKGCFPVSYKDWETSNFTDEEFWKKLEYVPMFTNRMRVSTPFSCAGLLMNIAGTICAFLGHCHSRSNLLISCVLYSLGGIAVGGGLFAFASILSGVYYESHGAVGEGGPFLHYSYSWGFFGAVIALTLSQFSAICCVTSYLNGFQSVEEMVCATVPGASRRLQQSRTFIDGYTPRAPDLCEPAPALLVDTDPEPMLPQDLPPPLLEAPNAEEGMNTRTLPSGRARAAGLRYAEPPRPPAQFCTLPRRQLTTVDEGSAYSKSAV